MDATYANGDPVFSRCSKITIRVLQGLAVIGSVAFCVIHITTYFSTHALASVIPQIMSRMAKIDMKKKTVEDFV